MNTLINSVEQSVNTGGNIYNDIITLSNGYIIRISEDGIGIYKNNEDDQYGEACGGANFIETE